jgi:hypothetical protein
MDEAEEEKDGPTRVSFNQNPQTHTMSVKPVQKSVFPSSKARTKPKKNLRIKTTRPKNKKTLREQEESILKSIHSSVDLDFREEEILVEANSDSEESMILGS